LALKIHSYHKENKFFTLDNLLHFAKEEVEYTAGRTTLYKILKSMGYRYKKVNGRKIFGGKQTTSFKEDLFLKKVFTIFKGRKY
jgi:transposase